MARGEGGVRAPLLQPNESALEFFGDAHGQTASGACSAVPVLKGDRISFAFPEGIFSGCVTDAGHQYRNVHFDDGDRLKLKLSDDRRRNSASELQHGEWCFVHSPEPGSGPHSPTGSTTAPPQSLTRCRLFFTAPRNCSGAGPEGAGRCGRHKPAQMAVSLDDARDGISVTAVLVSEDAGQIVRCGRNVRAVLVAQYCGGGGSSSRSSNGADIARSTDRAVDKKDALCFKREAYMTTSGHFAFERLELPRVGHWTLELTPQSENFRFVSGSACCCAVKKPAPPAPPPAPPSAPLQKVRAEKRAGANVRAGSKVSKKRTGPESAAVKKKVRRPRKQANPRRIGGGWIPSPADAQDPAGGSSVGGPAKQPARKRGGARNKPAFAFEALECAGDTYTIFSKKELYQVSAGHFSWARDVFPGRGAMHLCGLRCFSLLPCSVNSLAPRIATLPVWSRHRQRRRVTLLHFSDLNSCW
jgi:hypothetical protein